MKTLFAAALTAMSTLLLGACGELWNGPSGQECTAIAVAGVSVYVEALGSSLPICDAEVTLSNVDGYREALEAFDPADGTCSYAGAWERPGTYKVEVRREGYETYRSEPVSVRRTGDGCHVEAVVLEIGLRKSVEED